MAKQKPIYDPNVKYGWNNDTEFILKGNEFGLILNVFRTVLADPDAQRILLLSKANDTMETLLQRNVESGNVKPADIPEAAPMVAVKED